MQNTPEEKEVHNIYDLDQLARQWPILFGKALDLSNAIEATKVPYSGRPDFVDDKSPEIQQALRALDRLHQLHQNPNTRRAAEVLLYARVACGTEARTQGKAYLRIALIYRSAPKKMTPSKEKALIELGRKLYNQACATYQNEL
jgi:hypothetical protein